MESEHLYSKIKFDGYWKSIQDIECAIKSSDDNLRAEIASLLGEYENEHSQKCLIKLLNDNRRFVRLEAVVSLSTFDSDKVYDELIRLIHDRYFLIRGYAICGIAHAAPTDKLDFTKNEIKHILSYENNTFVRIKSRFSLYVLGCDEQIQLIFKMFNRCDYRNKCTILNSFCDLLEDGKLNHIHELSAFFDTVCESDETNAVRSAFIKLKTMVSRLQL